MFFFKKFQPKILGESGEATGLLVEEPEGEGEKEVREM